MQISTVTVRLAPLIALVVIASATPAARAGTYTNDFSSGLAGATLNGSAALDNGSVLLTPNTGSLQGTLILPDLDPEAAAPGFLANFTMTSGPGSDVPADGISFVFGQLANDSSFGEEGPAGLNGLVVSADYYINGPPPNGDETRREYTVSVNGVQVGAAGVDPYTNGVAMPVNVFLTPEGLLSLTVGATPIFTNLGTGFETELGDRFGFGARTGGLQAENRIDNLTIITGIPEPTSLGLLAIGGLLLARRRA
jgi:hypothetical protein